MTTPKRLLPRPNNGIMISTSPPSPSPVISPVVSSPDLTNSQIKGQICELYFRPESKAEYQQQMLKASETRFKTGIHAGKKYCDVLKIDPKYIMYMLRKKRIYKTELRDYLIVSMPSFYLH
jgi:hypothetical protein